jgi:hypothetical protein
MAMTSENPFDSVIPEVPKLSLYHPRVALTQYISSPTDHPTLNRLFSYKRFSFHMIHSAYVYSYFDDYFLLSLEETVRVL